MRAVVVSEPGGPDVLTWGEVPDPEAGPGEVLIEVAASAVNRADLLQRQGHYPPPPGASEVLGLECSGTVAAIGAGVEGWSVGDEVCALLAGGGYAERVVVPAGQVMRVPAGIDLVTAASLPEVTCTVWSNLFMVAALQPGEWLLVHGGTSGVGTMAVQLAKALGAHVVTTSGTGAKCERARELGADAALDYHGDWVDGVREVTGGHGADVVLDNMGAAYLGRNVEVLAVNGRLVVIGLQGGRRAELDLGTLLAKRAAVVATALRARPAAEKAAIVAAVAEHVWPLVASGTVRPVVDRVLSMDRAAEAHRVVEAGEHVGKVLLRRPQ